MRRNLRSDLLIVFAAVCLDLAGSVAALAKLAGTAAALPSRAKTRGNSAGKGARSVGVSPHSAGEIDMAKGEQRSNRETKKPKKDKIKTIAAAPSQKTGGWQPTANTGKKK
jgi:hypothetical protein